jgi:alanine racemase
MPRPIEAIVDLQALRGNLSVAKSHAAPSRVFAVVKANAYGHGLMRVLPALGDADGFAVIELEAALRIRDSVRDKPVLLLEGFFDREELDCFATHALGTVVHERSQLEMLLGAKLARPVDVFVKLNTGMNRLGFAPDELAAILPGLVASGNVGDVVAMTHFADADGIRGVDWQLQPLLQVTAANKLQICAANSAALLRYPQTRGAWVRPGIMLYGASPFADLTAAQLGLQPVMTLRSRIIAVQSLTPGDCVGYGCTFSADKPTRVGIVAAGYGDGYPRHAPTGTPVLVDGQRSRTVGLVSMDSLCVDLSTLPQAGVGSLVTLWGRDMPVEEVAAAAGTVSYELLTRLTARVAVSVVD